VRGLDAGKKVKGRRRHIVVDIEGSHLIMQVPPADVQDRDGGAELLAKLISKVPTATKVFADGAYRGERMEENLKEHGIANVLEIVERPKDAKGFTVLYRR